MQGHNQAIERQKRREANWMALILSAQSTETVTPAMLLGEEEERDLMAELKEADRRIAKLRKARNGRKK
jgi:hypothetical protein